MATSSIVIAGATYSDVPSVTLKDTSNADVSFILTSDADATASDIRKNKIAYSQGQKIVGDYELNLQEKIADSSTSAQEITADGGSITYSINIESQAMTYDTDAGEVFTNYTVLNPIVVDDTYSIHVSYYRAGYDLTYEYNGSFVCTTSTFPYSINLTNDSAPTGEETVSCLIKKDITGGEVSCPLLGEDDLPTGNTITLQIYQQIKPYDGLSKVTINPYTLNEKTVTPTTTSQVVTPNNATQFTYGNAHGYYTESSQRAQINITWDNTLVSGDTYHVYARGFNPTNSRTYTFEGDVVYSGFPITFNADDGNGNKSDFSISSTLCSCYIGYVAVTKRTQIEVEVSVTQEDHYDGLSKVTVNPIPSEYIIPSGTLSVTDNGTVDVSAYQYANVNVSGGSQTQSKTATPTKSTQTITPDSGYLLSSVVVNPIPNEYIIPNLQTRTGVTPTKSSQTITPSSGYDGLASVQINAIPSNYIDTTDATASASDIRTGKSAYVNGIKVNGSLVVNKVYVGSTDPASSFGNDGDIYIKVV